MNVAEIMTSSIESVAEADSIAMAAVKMRDVNYWRAAGPGH